MGRNRENKGGSDMFLNKDFPEYRRLTRYFDPIAWRWASGWGYTKYRGAKSKRPVSGINIDMWLYASMQRKSNPLSEHDYRAELTRAEVDAMPWN